MKVIQAEIVDFKSQLEWRDWLDKNHVNCHGLWLFLYKKKAKIKGLTYTEAVEEALCFGWIDGIVKSWDNEKFIQRFTPRKKNSIWSLVNKNKAELLIKEGRIKKKGMKAIEEAKSNGKWENAYSSKHIHSIPEDLEEALKKSNSTLSNFNSFTNSQKNIYINWINNAKREETRKTRIDQVVQRALNNIKPGNNFML